jgi:hypothetical protein
MSGNLAEDIIGRKFNKLLVIKRLANNRRNNSVWQCLCECGKTTIVTGNYLRNNITKSCGCIRKGINSKPYGIAAMNRLYSIYKKGADKRKLVFDLSIEVFIELTSSNCYYCNRSPESILTRHHINGAYIYNGIDRIDNTKGYTDSNVVPCCKRCNLAKGTLTRDEFIQLGRDIVMNIDRSK